MAGMKEGPGDDPFADDDTEESNKSVEQVSGTDESGQQSSTTEPTTQSQYPYVLRRQTVKEDRNRELVIFARDEFAELEDDVRKAVADELGMSSNDVPVTDLREAYIEVARRHPETMAEVLNDWGYEALK